MNICIVTPQYKVDSNTNSGIANHYYELAHGLKELGHTIHVVFISDHSSNIEKMNDVDTGSIYLHPVNIRLPRWLDKIVENNWAHHAFVSKLFTSFILRNHLQKIVKTYAIDVIETTSYDFLCLGYVVLPHKVPVVTRVSTTQYQINRDHYSMKSRAIDWIARLEHAMVHSSDHLTTHTRAHRDAVCEDFNVESERFEIIPHGIELPNKYELGIQSAQEKDTVMVLYVGRFEHRKGIDILLAAIPRILQSYPKAQFMLVGNDPQKENERKFKESWGDQGNNQQVKFLGQIDTATLHKLYQTCDLFVAPSRYESFGLIYVEAMSYGKPVIGCHTGGVPEVIKEGVTGLLAQPNNLEDLTQKILKLLNNNALRHYMGEQARAWVQEKFSRERMASSTIGQYRKLEHLDRRVFSAF